MANFSLWDPRKNLDYQYFDEMIQEMFSVGATSIFVHKYLGVTEGGPVTEIEDPVFQENRTRKYDPDIYELLGVYNVQELEYDLTQFGQIVAADVMFMSLHLNDSVRRIGRKIMPGDVFEIPALRDDMLLDESTPPVNKYYVVEEVTREANGYSPTWYPHLLRVKLNIITSSQEFDDIFKQPPLDGNGDPIDGVGSGPDGGLSLEDIISDYQKKIDLNNRVVEIAEQNVDRRNFQTAHFYVVPGDEKGKQYPWIFAGDGQPPNGAQLAGSGNRFPTTEEGAQDGDWYLRTDMEPYVLFKKEGSRWRRYEVDYRKRWQAAHRILETFINNNRMTTIDGETFAEKQAISTAVGPKADF